MLYKPNFCCNCGEKIERASWSLLTSRRFCGLCETEFKGADYLPRVAVIAAALVMIVGTASYLRSGPSPARPARLTQSRNPASEALVEKPVNATAPKPETAASSTEPKPAANSPANSLQRQITQKTSTESVYYCGALTKKGTPCTRRVKTKGRCWQHNGQPPASEFR